ncbi:icarapin-like [Venturia canescens]|uniref:icarapin-like n=1 Tax=Venturia canescens TaxID=32260 RepID=UPI001C9C7090|nr:icarapin-like [Venturia canescens]
MKRPLFSVFILASLMVAIAHCFPGPMRPDLEDNDEDGPDSVLVMPGRNPFSLYRPFFRISEFPSFDDDSKASSPEDPFDADFPWRESSFGGFFDGLQGLMNRIQKQMADVLSSLPRPGSFGPGGRIPEGGNTTSTTKIINGHVVTINETTYQSGNNDSNIVLRVNIVDVKPVNSTGDGNGEEVEVDLGGGEEIETITTRTNDSSNNNDTSNTKKQDAGEERTTQAARSVETVEDSAGNEIPMKEQVDTLNA